MSARTRPRHKLVGELLTRYELTREFGGDHPLDGRGDFDEEEYAVRMVMIPDGPISIR